MQLDYIRNINEHGDNIVRLYDFNKSEANKFRNQLFQSLIIDKKQLDLADLDFITSRNCRLIFRLSDSDEGITTINHKHFFCDLTQQGYETMLLLLDPFCIKETKGYQFLYDIDSQTDLLFSPAGTW